VTAEHHYVLIYINPIMSRAAHCLSLLVTMIVVLLLLMSLEVQAQSTVDDDDSCQSTYTTLDETVTARNVKIIKEDLTEVKSVLGSHQQSAGTNETARDVGLKIMQDLAEMKNLLLGSVQQSRDCGAVYSSSLCKYMYKSKLYSKCMLLCRTILLYFIIVFRSSRRSPL